MDWLHSRVSVAMTSNTGSIVPYSYGYLTFMPTEVQHSLEALDDKRQLNPRP